MHRFPRCLGLSLALFTAATARAQLTQGVQFPGGGSLVGCAYDPVTDTVWTYPSFGTDFRKYSSAGALLGTIPRPGGSANDADLEFVPVAFTLNGTPIPAGSLLYIDGENGAAEIYALDATSGAVLATLATASGTSHVVGGAFHPQRGTIFLVQDRVPSVTTQRNLVAEISPATGQVLASFYTTQANPTFTVNFGDLDVTANGNLMIVSSDESEIGQFTPSGAWVQGHPLPAGVNSLCGIGLDETGCRLWVAESGGTVHQLMATCPAATTFANGCPSSGGSNTLTATSLPWIGSTFRATATGLPANALVVAVTSFVPLVPPLALSSVVPQGVPGCNLHVTPDVLLWLLASGGTAQYQIFFPADPTFVGVQFYHQMVAIELAPAGIISVTSTNALQMTVGSY